MRFFKSNGHSPLPIASERGHDLPDIMQLLDAMPVAAGIYTTDLQIVAVSEKFLIMTSKRRDELIGRYVYDVWPTLPEEESPTGAEKLKQSIERVVLRKIADSMPITRWDGDFDKAGNIEHYWQPVNSPIFNRNGDVAYILHTTVNVTESVLAKKAASETERQMELTSQELRASEENLKTARASESATKQDLYDFIMQAPMPMVIIMGPDLLYTLANPAHDRLVNRKTMGKTLSEVFAEEERQYHLPILKGVLETGEPYVGNELPLTLIEDDGSIRERYTNLSFTALRGAEGEIRGVLGLAHDVTEMVVARRKLETLTMDLECARQELTSVLDATPTYITRVDAKERYIFQNKANAQYFARSTDIIGLTMLEYFGAETYAEMQPHIRAAQSGKLVQFEWSPSRDPSGARRHYMVTYIPESTAEGKVYGFVSSVVDITEVKQAREQFKAAVEAAESANAAKSAFLANMSHELRTPMTAILGFTEVLQESSVTDEEKRDALQRIESGGRALLRLIDDILDISKIEAGKLTMEKSVFSPFEVVSEAAAVVRHAAEQKGVELRLEFDPDIPRSAYSDPARIRQILTNVLGNAVKFTSRGEVHLRAKMERPLHLVFEITDTGIGISKENQERLFQRFAQADTSITRKFGGTGLGLMLSRKLSEELGGSLLLVESMPDKGSKFQIRIEAAPFDLESSYLKQVSVNHALSRENERQEQTLNGMRILVAEDTYSNQMLMRRFLSIAGAEVDLVSNGEEAVEKAQQEQFDIILMDIQMPKMDGIQATKTLRSIGYRGPIVALTAHAMKEEIVRSLEAGYDDHLTKPISAKALVAAVSFYHRRSTRFPQHRHGLQ